MPPKYGYGQNQGQGYGRGGGGGQQPMVQQQPVMNSIAQGHIPGNLATGGYTVKPMNGYQNDWNTTTCQCGGPPHDIINDCCFAYWLQPCAAAVARENADGTPCCYGCVFTTPCVNANIVRHRYNIRGDDGEDALKGMFCPCCQVRQAYTESKIRGMVPVHGQYHWGNNVQDFHKDLMACNPGNFCYALFCPNCMVGSIRANFDGSSCCFNCLFATPCTVTNMVRHAYGIRGDAMMDCLTTLFCFPCAMDRAHGEVYMQWMKHQAQQIKQAVNNKKKKRTTKNKTETEKQNG